ncbi:MAG: class I SAM-dependent methyltransferase [Kofleriaceae bacterium]
MTEPSTRETILRRFHAERPGITSSALARAGSYHRLAELVPPGARVLDLACGDGYLLELLAARGARPIGVDLSAAELAAARARSAAHPLVLARAQALPLATGAVDACVSHFAFMLMDDPEQVVRELARVIAPGGWFAAVLGGGPTAHGDDAFHRYLALTAEIQRAAPRFGDPRTKSEEGWRELFAGWGAIAFERWELDLTGSFEQVWHCLGGTYAMEQVDRAAIGEQLRAVVADLIDGEGRVPCRMVAWLATVQR